jgi:hypothetical protein
MARRTFRYNPKSGRMEEILPYDDTNAGHFVFGDVPEFVSPLDGTRIQGRKQYEEHCRKHNVVPTEALKGATREQDRYGAERERRQLREMLWEYTDKSMRGRACRD